MPGPGPGPGRGLGAAPPSAAVASPYRSIGSMLVAVWRAEGVRGLYAGMGPTMVGILPYAGLKWFVYQGLKQQYWHNVGGGHGGA